MTEIKEMTQKVYQIIILKHFKLQNQYCVAKTQFIQQLIIYYKIFQNKMFQSQDISINQDKKPPQFFSPIESRKLKNQKILMKSSVTFISNKNDTSQQVQVILYEEYISVLVNDKNYGIEIDLIITFQVDKINRTISFKDCERCLAIKIRFEKINDFQYFYHHIKKYMFQTNFNSKYQIMNKIGSGKTSQVFLIQNKSNGQFYAGKFYSNIPSSIHKQIRILRVIQHPNLIFFHEMFIQNGQAYLIMDYQDGGNLLQQIQAKQFFTIKQKVNFLTDMLNAFQFLRIKQIVHRDLKPENILYSKKHATYKIADFELAIYQRQPINRLVGTAGYMAPQLFKSDNQILASQLSDIYSLGLVYFQIATKQRYFTGSSVKQILYKNQKSQKLSHHKYSKQNISPQQVSLLQMMIRTQPQKRSLSIKILQSIEIRTLIKTHVLEKSRRSVGSTKCAHDQAEEDRKDDNFVDKMKGMFSIRRKSLF